MWGLVLAVVAIAIASDREVRIKKLQNRLWDDELRIRELTERLSSGGPPAQETRP